MGEIRLDHWAWQDWRNFQPQGPESDWRDRTWKGTEGGNRRKETVKRLENDQQTN